MIFLATWTECSNNDVQREEKHKTSTTFRGCGDSPRVKVNRMRNAENETEVCTQKLSGTRTHNIPAHLDRDVLSISTFRGIRILTSRDIETRIDSVVSE